MANGPYTSPEEEALQRMILETGSPQAAANSLLDRLEALEAAVEALETRTRQQVADDHAGNDLECEPPRD